MIIHKNFVGGNIKVTRQTETDVYVENELKDTTENWFYWAFCVDKRKLDLSKVEFYILFS